MLIISLGLAIWITIHLFPSVAPNKKELITNRLGNNAYQGIFALLILIGLGLIIYGWRNTVPSDIYNPVYAIRHPAMLLVVCGFILMAAANFPTSRINRFIRHPQLSGVLLWAIAHLLMNGDSRSVTVFSALAIWCVVSIFTINRRDGKWIKPEKTSEWGQEVLILFGAIIVSAIVVFLHEYLSGIKLLS